MSFTSTDYLFAETSATAVIPTAKAAVRPVIDTKELASQVYII